MEESTPKKVHPRNLICRLCCEAFESRHLTRVFGRASKKEGSKGDLSSKIRNVCGIADVIKQRSPSVIAALKLAIKDEIAAACQTLCRRSDGSVLYSNRNSFETLKEFDLDRVWTEMKSNVPFFIEIMNAVSGKNLGMENTELVVRVKFCFLYSVLMNERWHELSLLKRVNTILIIEGGCTKKVCTVFVFFVQVEVLLFDTQL